jgi:phenylalanyl-tRNA synthetase alpha chain
LAVIWQTQSLKDLENLRIKYLGKRGQLTILLKEIPRLDEGSRKSIGILANDVKKAIEQAIVDTRGKILGQKERGEWFDVTLPAILPPDGHLHPITQILHEVLDIFKFLGYQATETQEIQTDFYNFTSLNMPVNSPSRDTQATFYLDTRGAKVLPGEILLQTQVTSMQVPIMKKTKPPVRAVMPGKVYRVDSVDPSHAVDFWQIDGFLVDKNVQMSHLLGTLEYVLRKLYGPEIKIRFDATNFAFVEPGVQAYMSCTICQQRGCPFCKQTGWVEILPAGMIHPSVLKTAGLDPKEWGGFAFDLGLSRAAVLKYQINDLRVLTNPDLRILRQF